MNETSTPKPRAPGGLLRAVQREVLHGSGNANPHAWRAQDEEADIDRAMSGNRRQNAPGMR